MSLQIHERTQARVFAREVYFLGSVALSKGQGVCYDRDVGTATEADGKRDKDVQLPDNTNNNSFAGVVVRAYSAVTGGQWIKIYEPGSVCQVLLDDAAATIGENSIVTCMADSANTGEWTTDSGYRGRGSAQVLQTVTAAGLLLVKLDDGLDSGLVELVPTATLTAGGAATFMVGGKTILGAGAATPATDVTFTIADGTYIGQKKCFKLTGILTTNDVVITVTSGVQLDGSTALATLTMDGALDQSNLEYSGEGASGWRLMHNAGTALA